jgi:hypothetical protein
VSCNPNCYDFFESKISPMLPLLDLPMASRRLDQVVEGGSKQRVFAIGNYINQPLLGLIPSIELTPFRASIKGITLVQCNKYLKWLRHLNTSLFLRLG